MARTVPELPTALLPAAAAEGRLHRLELEPRGQPRALDALGARSCRRRKKRSLSDDAAHLQALELQRLEALADDELGAAAADVDHQAPARLARHRVRDTGVDQARLFHAGDDFDRMAERLARALEEGLLAARDAQRVGADDAHAVARACRAAAGRSARRQAQRARRDLLVEPAVLVDAGAEAHHLAQAVDDDELAVRVARDHHVEAVGAEVDRRQDVGDGAVQRGAGRRRGTAARACAVRRVNEDPQPQVVVAFGLRITNCAPSRPSR